ncbi:hypothetical protein ID866_4439 [Astraeus odoratus]|nr:hypothetical protein ID866_4439 [Astraeus odoratus]
MPNCKRTQ